MFQLSFPPPEKVSRLSVEPISRYAALPLNLQLFDWFSGVRFFDPVQVSLFITVPLATKSLLLNQSFDRSIGFAIDIWMSSEKARPICQEVASFP
jgi:hypothetical protein